MHSEVIFPFVQQHLAPVLDIISASNPAVHTGLRAFLPECYSIPFVCFFSHLVRTRWALFSNGEARKRVSWNVLCPLCFLSLSDLEEILQSVALVMSLLLLNSTVAFTKLSG